MHLAIRIGSGEPQQHLLEHGESSHACASYQPAITSGALNICMTLQGAKPEHIDNLSFTWADVLGSDVNGMPQNCRTLCMTDINTTTFKKPLDEMIRFSRDVITCVAADKSN
jgi:hypothetical protein